ncbi:MAG: hypothetical protein VKN33_00290 [Candidatus Sericytochromatia bacterium]|nr:hypothetical protein [Candidatus Sericytochromatia bacterium]
MIDFLGLGDRFDRNPQISLDKLQVVLGHADITTTRVYVQTSGLEVAVEMADWF